jgi:hypothetical protein
LDAGALQKKKAAERAQRLFEFLAEWTGLYAKSQRSLTLLDFFQLTLQKSATTVATTPAVMQPRGAEETHSSPQKAGFSRHTARDAPYQRLAVMFQ